MHSDDPHRQLANVVRQQLAVGLDLVNDGQFGKSSWAAYVLERSTGFEIRRDTLIPLNWLGRQLRVEALNHALEGDSGG